MLDYNWINKDFPNTGGWQQRHIAATLNPQGFERGIVPAIEAWIDYACVHQARYDSKIGDDGILGAAWFKWGEALRTLLNGDCGRLDCGTLDSIIYGNLVEQGWTE